MNRRAWIFLMAATLVFAGCSKKNANVGPDLDPTRDTSGSSSTTDPNSGKNNPSNPSGSKSNESGTFIYSPVYFDYDDATLSDQARNILAATGAHLSKTPEKVTVEGHCDERGSVEYNLALGEHRAGAVKDYLVSYGIGRDLINTVSFGKERPADMGHDESAWSRNRRAEFRVNR